MPLTPAPTLQAIRDDLGQLSCALLAVRDLAKDIQDFDNPQFRIAVLIGVLGEQADALYGQLAEYMDDVTHPEE